MAVHFALIEDNDDGTYRTIEGSEFVIAREAHRNNASFYTINDRRVQFKEVATLLKKHNVDLDHNRFLILQVCFEQNEDIMFSRAVPTVLSFRVRSNRSQ